MEAEGKAGRINEWSTATDVIRVSLFFFPVLRYAARFQPPPVNSDGNAQLGPPFLLRPPRFRLRIRFRMAVRSLGSMTQQTVQLSDFSRPTDLQTHRDDGGTRHFQTTALAPPPPITAPAPVDENANRAHTSYPTSSPANSSLASSAASLTATSPIPILRLRAHHSENQTQNPGASATPR
ncbi:hypothetical protein MSAN_01501600 [Mycena sanguinolenta]|uniref:Uncharacterized protein n=1 Tax=Mycena sanguinolenta TaxID=230812 RepID=A0A8H7CZ11_9AGAR|nr:hypothetical protein MSAN_01501600 [Mycena sanguinolenta]